MILFRVAVFPFVFATMIWYLHDRSQVRWRISSDSMWRPLVGRFLIGTVVALPAWLLIGLFGRLLPESARPFPSLVNSWLGDYAIPAAAALLIAWGYAALGNLLDNRVLGVSSRPAVAAYVELALLLSFVMGFFSVFELLAALRVSDSRTIFALFVRTPLRWSLVVLICLAIVRVLYSTGSDRFMYVAIMLLAPVFCGLAGSLFAAHYTSLSLVIACSGIAPGVIAFIHTLRSFPQ